MVASSLILIGGCSVLRSRTSLRTSGSKVPRRAAACSAPNRPRMPSFSKPMIRRRRVVSGVPVWRALSVTGLPKTTGGRIRSYSTCSGHFRSSLSCPHSSVGSTRVRLAFCRSPPATPFLLPPASSFPSPRADVAISSGSSHSSSVFRGDRMPRQWTRGKFPPPTIQICVTSLWRGLSRALPRARQSVEVSGGRAILGVHKPHTRRDTLGGRRNQLAIQDIPGGRAYRYRRREDLLLTGSVHPRLALRRKQGRVSALAGLRNA